MKKLLFLLLLPISALSMEKPKQQFTLEPFAKNKALIATTLALTFSNPPFISLPFAAYTTVTIAKDYMYPTPENK